MGEALQRLLDQVGEWRGVVVVHPEALIWAEQRLSDRYQTWRKFADSFWADAVCLERRVHLRLGVFGLWHQPEVDIIHDDELGSSFVPLSGWSQHWEVLHLN